MKVKKIVFNFITYGLIGYTAFAAFYSVLPPEYQHESFNTLTALISGVSTGGIGSALLLIKAWLSKSEKITDEKTTDTIAKFIDVLDYVKGLENKVATLENKLHEQYTEQTKKDDRIIALLETDLKAKLSNKLIDQEVRELINGVLEDEEKVV